MKKIYYLLFFYTFFANAQFSIINEETNTPVNDGDVFVFHDYYDGTNDSHTGDLEFIITNNDNSNQIHLYMEAIQLINTSGSSFTHCWDICRFGISLHNPYGPLNLDAGASTPQGNIHFQNNAAGTDPNANVDYVIKIYQLDDQNNEVASLTFTYRYVPTTGIVQQLTKEEFQLSVNYGSITINSKYASKVSIYNLTGQKIKELAVNKGKTIINTDFTKGIYIIHAVADNRELYQRIIIN